MTLNVSHTDLSVTALTSEECELGMDRDITRRDFLLDNHPIIAGEAKPNEFMVREQRLIGRQGSNGVNGVVVRRDLLRLRDEPAAEFQGNDEQLRRWLDTMTYEDYHTQYRGLPSEVARYLDPIITAGAEGVRVARQVPAMP